MVTPKPSMPPSGARPMPVQVVPTKVKSFTVPSRQVMVLTGSGVLVVVLAMMASLVVQNLLRGGADSPEQAADKAISSISNVELGA